MEEDYLIIGIVIGAIISGVIICTLFFMFHLSIFQQYDTNSYANGWSAGVDNALDTCIKSRNRQIESMTYFVGCTISDDYSVFSCESSRGELRYFKMLRNGSLYDMNNVIELTNRTVYDLMQGKW